MDYSIINQVYEEIIIIVNEYARKSNCEYEVARKLSFVLLGYYLVLGPHIFSKLNILLDSIRIYECVSEEEYQKKAIEVAPRLEEKKDTLRYNPITIWDYKCDENNKFLGGIPNVIYMKDETVDNVLGMAHEMSHGLEGTSAMIDSEDDDYAYVKQGFTSIIIDKVTKAFKTKDGGFIELVTSTLETKILKAFLKLDEKEVTSSLLKEFLNEIKSYKGKNVMSRSYETLNVVFKDLTDNDVFYNMIREHFYDNDEDGFRLEYESYDSRLKYRILKSAAEYLAMDDKDISQVLYYSEIIKRQAEIFNKATNFEPDKKILILV